MDGYNRGSAPYLTLGTLKSLQCFAPLHVELKFFLREFLFLSLQLWLKAMVLSIVFIINKIEDTIVNEQIISETTRKMYSWTRITISFILWSIFNRCITQFSILMLFALFNYTEIVETILAINVNKYTS